MKKITFITVLSLSLASISAFAASADDAAKIHASSAGKLITIHGGVGAPMVEQADGSQIYIDASDLSVSSNANTLCDLSKQWSVTAVANPSFPATALYCIAN